jgi:hypothetical protein
MEDLTRSVRVKECNEAGEDNDSENDNSQEDVETFPRH